MRSRSSLAALIASALLLRGCSPQERPPRVQAVKVPKTTIGEVRRPAAQPPSAAEYVARAGALDLYEIAAAELALQRSANRSVRDYAAMMSQAHKGTSSQLSLAGRRLNLLPARALDPTYQLRLGQLRSAPSFDLAYKRQQQTVHQEALALHSSYAARGTSPTLRPVAKAAVPIMQRHLRLLRYL